MIRDFKAYALIREAEYWRDLSHMSIDDSIHLGEALLTSQLMGAYVGGKDTHPMSLARSLGIEPKRKNRRD